MRSRFTEQKKQQILKEGGSKVGVKDVCRKYGISASTFYRWKATQGYQITDPILHMKSLQLENRRLKHRVAELSLDYNILRSALVSDRESEC